LSQQADGVLTLTFDRPKANALDVPMAETLLAELERAHADDTVRCVLLIGRGRFFSAGQDVSTIATATPEVVRSELRRVYNRLILRLRRLDKPVVAAINGPAAGAGLGLALATDVRIAAQRARFVFGFSALGLTADSGVSLLLPALVGLARAADMAFLEESLTAEQALAYGLVHRVVPDDELAEAAATEASRLAQGPTRAFALTKQAFNRGVLADLEDCLELEAGLQASAVGTSDAREGVKAYLEKRPPHFRGA
jgi:2-(1,2-epoxy-1,2-dihydrophenyl)acetyl-CoA isomerase